MVKISLNENVSKLKEKSKAKNTQDKYNGDWLKFIDYCKNKYNCSPLDVDDFLQLSGQLGGTLGALAGHVGLTLGI